jgi:hypothetical protein
MPRLLPATTAVLLAAALAGMARGQAVPVQPASSSHDPRLAELRRAAAQWQLRGGPARRVVDQVCLVPDVATFYEALATWDEGQFFPILIDDAELDLKFLRAFRPARVVRFAGRGRPIERGDEWARAVAAVGEAWSSDGAAPEAKLKGDAPPGRLGKTPPGVVVGRPTSPSLPGLAALAAGRFQTMVRLDSRHQMKDNLGAPEIAGFCDALAAALGAKLPEYARLGDDCDFITLAGDYPYRYNSPKGAMAVDDRAGRDAGGKRWAFAGRLLGDAKWSVYAAMCSLFLGPQSAILFDTYSETSDPWKVWSLRAAGVRLAPIAPTALIVGDRRATLKTWHETFDLAGRFGLVFLNSMGGPKVFNVAGGSAHALDIMPTPPAIVSVIHSYSAADPANPDTIAGHWLAQGAFLYHGAMDEPFLNAFRRPVLVAELLATGVPFAAAQRPLADEPFGQPWKLVVLGDPLYRLVRVDGDRQRSHDFPGTASWIVYGASPPPKPDDPEPDRLGWALNAALIQATAGAPDTSGGVLAVLRSIDRGRLPGAYRPVFDELTAVLLYDARRLDALRAFVAATPRPERTAGAVRLAVSAALAEFAQSVARGDFERAAPLWSEMVGAGVDPDFVGQLTARLGPLADAPSRREVWRERLRSALTVLENRDAKNVLTAELKRLDEAEKSRPAR